MLQTGGNGQHPVPTLQIITCRMILTLTPGIIYLYLKSVPDFILGDREVRRLLFVRAVAGIIGVGAFYASMIYLPLVEATVISFISPLLATILTSKLTGSNLSMRQLCASCVCFIGVLCITLSKLFDSADGYYDDPNKEARRNSSLVLGVLIALTGVVGSSITIICVRRIGSRAHPLITMNYLAYSMLFLSVILYVVPSESISYSWDLVPEQWITLAGVGLFAFLMEILQTTGFAIDSSPRAVNMLYFQAVLALCADLVIWKTKFSVWSLAGAGCIITGLICIGDAAPQDVKSISSISTASETELQNIDGQVNDQGRTS
ncbi:uncharacterized protein JN550_008022 [Neoarthrinium moseri]|uniref:uncharacterized protein n=1 Tax=Neoarthrinium moseri TaxID=1658444 RepID=UPI001FDBD214|nr:uncharacterized protein JN550_008022 [Neoarthrinium moseri]KAI1866044.1 hypothetical protein JN550_008022 [Neoarthrinium moseri]